MNEAGGGCFASEAMMSRKLSTQFQKPAPVHPQVIKTVEKASGNWTGANLNGFKKSRRDPYRQPV